MLCCRSVGRVERSRGIVPFFELFLFGRRCAHYCLAIAVVTLNLDKEFGYGGLASRCMVSAPSAAGIFLKCFLVFRWRRFI